MTRLRSNLSLLGLGLLLLIAAGAVFFVYREVGALQAQVDRVQESITRLHFRVQQSGKERGGVEAFLLEKEADPDRPNVIIIVPDAMRADSLGIYGGEGITPNLDKLARKNLYFPNAISQAGWTAPSFASLFTGQYPISHRYFNRHQEDRLDRSLPLLQELFQKKGYYTVALAARNYYSWLQQTFSRGFNEVHVIEDDRGISTLEEAYRFISTRGRLPYFLLIHIFDPHSPYTPELGMGYEEGVEPSRVNHINYLREVTDLDRRLGQFFKDIKALPDDLYDEKRDVLIFTSDHGEEFQYENGFHHHGRSPSIESIRVPLIMQIPGREPEVVEDYCDISGIFYALHDFLGEPYPSVRWPKLPPVSPLHAITGGVRYAFSEALMKDDHYPDMVEVKSIVSQEGLKLDFYTGGGEPRMFDLNEDPAETNNLFGVETHMEAASELLDALRARTLLQYDYR